MSIADSLRLLSLEATVARLLARVEALEARQGAETPAGAAGARDRDPPTQRPSSAPGGDAVVLGKHGGDRRSEAAKGQAGQSILNGRENTKAHWLARLDRDRPDLAQRVRAKEISAHAAAIEAGFRKRMISVPADADAAGRSGRAP